MQAVVGPLVKDQRCSNQIFLDTGGVTLCQRSICPVENGKLLAKAVSSNSTLEPLILHVSTVSPRFPPDQDPAWTNIQNYILEDDLFPSLEQVSLAEKDAILVTSSKWFLAVNLFGFEDPGAALNSYTATLSSYTCSGQLTATATSSQCPSNTVSFTWPKTSTSVLVCPSTFLI